MVSWTLEICGQLKRVGNLSKVSQTHLHIMSDSKTKSISLLLSSVASIVYLVYRLLYTMNMDGYYAVCVSVLLLVGEAHGIMLMLLYFYQIRNTEPAPAPAVLSGKTVDVFLATYNEDVPLLRGSIQSYLKFDYPCRIHVLDDGNREEVRLLAESMGVNYITREDNLHAKAGNINNALEQTDGEFVIIFDADHVARSNFISRTVGYFEDPRVAYVQTPHAFYNFFNFSSFYDLKKRYYWEEGNLFYKCIQLGKHNDNAVVFCGSAAMFRREALEDVGRIATETITEDMHTGLRLHARGWRSVFCDERLVAGQAAPDVTTFQSQRLRWGEGNMSIVKCDNPLTMPGLTLSQRLHYLGSMLGWTSGIPRLIIYATPILMMLTGISPIGHVTATYFMLLALHLTLAWTALYASGRGCFSLIGNEFSGMACFWVQIQATWRAIKRRNTNFVVTKKRGRQSNKILGAILPQVILLSFSVLALVVGLGRLLIGVPQSLHTFLIGGVLTVLHGGVAVMYLRRALSPGEKRFSTRHENARMPAEIIVCTEDSDTTAGVLGVCTDINENGMGVRSYEPVPVNAKVEIDLHHDGRVSHFQGTVCRRRDKSIPHRLARTEYEIGIRFEKLSEQDICELWQVGVGKVVHDVYERLNPESKSGSASSDGSLPLPISVISQEMSHTGDISDTRSLGVCTVADKWKITVDESDVSDGSVKFEIDTPLGAVAGSGQSRTSGDRHTITFDKFEEQGRSILAETTQKDTVAVLVDRAQNKAPFRITKRFVQTISVICMTGLLTTFGMIYTFHRPHISLTMLEQGLVSPDQTADQLRELTSRFLDGEMRDELMASRLVNVLNANGCVAESIQVTERLCEQFPNNDGYFLRYAEGLGQTHSADDLLKVCLNRVEIQADPSTPLLLETLRRAVACDRLDAIARILERLSSDHRLTSTQRLECIGYAINSDVADIASDMMTVPGSFSADRQLEAKILQIYALAAADGWAGTQDACNELIARFAAQDGVLLFAANGLYWGGHYSDALTAYRRLNPQRLTSLETLQMADCCLKCEDPETCVELCLSVDESTLLRSSLLLESLHFGQKHGSTTQEHIRKLVKDSYQPFSANERLLWAFVDEWTESDPGFVLRELEAAITRFPENMDLILQTANLCYQDGRFEKAMALLDKADTVENGTGWSIADRQMLKIRCTAAMVASPEFSKLFDELVELDRHSVGVDSEVRLEAAGLALQKGYSEQALQLLMDTPAADKTADYYRLKCGILAKSLKWAEVQAEGAEACQLFPNESEFRRLSGVAAICNGMFEEGLVDLQLSVELDTDSRRALKTRCLVARTQIWNNDWRRGLRELSVVTRLDPSTTTNEDCRAILFAVSRLDDLTSDELWLGSQSYNRIVDSKEPLTAELVNTTTSLLLRRQAYSTVLQLTDLYPEFRKADVWVEFNCGLALHGLQKYQQAIDCFQTVILKVENEQAAVARVALANSEYKGVRFDGIADANERKTTLLVDANLAAARSSVGAQRPDLAVIYFERAARLRPFDTETLYEYAGVLLLHGQFEKARDILPVRTSDLSLSHRLLRLQLLVTGDDFVRTSEELDELLVRFDSLEMPPTALWRLAEISAGFKRHVEAAALYQQYLSGSVPNRHEAQERYVRQIALTGDTAGAVDYFRRELSVDSCELESLVCLTSCFLNSDSAKSQADNTSYLQQISRRMGRAPLSPERSRLKENVVYCYVQSDDVQNAVVLLKELNVDLSDTRRDLLLLYAELTAQLGDIEASNQALRTLNK